MTLPLSRNRYFLNSTARSGAKKSGLFDADEYRQVNGFFQTQPTPLWHLPGLAAAVGVSDILIKDESTRLGLNAFKILGVSYAVGRLLREKQIAKGSILVCATEGNHGRAVAHVARENGLGAKVYMSVDAAASRVKQIEREGAEVVTIKGNYNDAVRLSAAHARRNGWTIVSDTAWPGYEDIPRLIMAGYTRLLAEAESQWSPEPPPDVVLVQAGVGGLTCAVVSWLCHRYSEQRPYTIACEPTSAACLLESARAGHPVSLRGPFTTIMAVLRSGEVSHNAWPTIAAAIDAFVAIEDQQCVDAMRALSHPVNGDRALVAGPSGVCGLAALFAVLNDQNLQPVLEASRLSARSRVFIINTEGADQPTTELLNRPE